MAYGTIIQAREGSTRLPGKVLLKVMDKTILEWMVERAYTLHPVIIATTPNSPNIISLCKKNKWPYYIGSETDVIQRVCDTADYFNIDHIVDLTSDCPLIDPYYVGKAISCYMGIRTVETINNREMNYHISNIVPREWPDGFDFQIYPTEILKNQLNNPKTIHEHTGWNLVLNPDIKKINITRPDKKYCYPEMRLTLDYREDFMIIKSIIEHFEDERLYTGGFIETSAQEIIDYILNRPKLLAIANRMIKQGE